MGNGNGNVGGPLLMVDRVRIPGPDGGLHNLNDGLHADSFNFPKPPLPLDNPRERSFNLVMKEIIINLASDNKDFPDFHHRNPRIFPAW